MRQFSKTRIVYVNGENGKGHLSNPARWLVTLRNGLGLQKVVNDSWQANPSHHGTIGTLLMKGQASSLVLHPLAHILLRLDSKFCKPLLELYLDYLVYLKVLTFLIRSVWLWYMASRPCLPPGCIGTLCQKDIHFAETAVAQIYILVMRTVIFEQVPFPQSSLLSRDNVFLVHQLPWDSLKNKGKVSHSSTPSIPEQVSWGLIQRSWAAKALTWFQVFLCPYIS